ncbi:ABC transporter permease [Euzebyella saccharophila]|uniref:ABC transporter permease n=1 Tax=Euzebyella saccharophila TaxID=679664 RepID=A0ABV8JKR0_9FLAO|nr:FtsX-like permease family protein [Euzebyella saccharophila]
MGQKQSSKTNISWLFKMAWRDGRASGKRLLLFMASIVLGIAAVVSVQSFSENLKANIALQSKELMGADFIIDSNKPPNERVMGIIDSLGGADAKGVSFPSMAFFSKNGDTKLVDVKGLEGNFPFYGRLETEPRKAADSYKMNKGALVDATLMLQFNLKEGDSISLGNTTIPIEGALISAPGAGGISASVAPPVIIPYELVENTGLIQVGSRIDYDFFFVAEPDQNMEELDKILDPVLDAENADLDTHDSTGRRLGRRYDNFGKFLNLVAFIALLLGCVGIASSVHIYMKEKLQSVAVLKCLGATRKQSFYIFLIQIAGMGLLGGLVGSLLGFGLQQFFPILIQGFLPFEIDITFSFKPVFLGLLLGVIMSVLFALAPLLSTWYVSPLQVLRVQESNPSSSKKVNGIILLGILSFIFVFAFLLLEKWSYAFYFVLGILVVFGILSGVAILFMRLVKKHFPHSWGFTARQSLLNLFRPNNQTLVLILAIGTGTFLISTLYFTKNILLAKANLENSAQAPNLIFLDIQSNEKEEVAKNLKKLEMPVINNIPIVTMRVQKIKDREANEIRDDSTSTINEWVLNHEFRVSYRDTLIGSEDSVEGSWPSNSSEEGVIPISLSDNVARDAEVGIGDMLTFNVQGVLINTEVVHIRSVDWGRMQLNFNIIFPSSVLEKAPQFHVITSNAANAKKSAEVQRAMVGKFPTVSIIDLRQVLTVVEGILDKISWVINFMAFFSILTGIIVLIGSVRTSKYQRIKESVLLRTLGAKGKQISKIAFLEYIYLGFIGSFIGVLLSLAGSLLLAIFVFKAPFVPSWEPFLIVVPLITIIVLTIGLWNNRNVLSSPPLEVLRKEVA